VLTRPAYLEALADLSPTTRGYVVLDATGWLVIALLGGVLLGGFVGLATYLLRWWLPDVRARTRKRRIDLTFSRTVALLFALSRGGIAVPEMLRTLRRNRAVYGAAADELSLAVRDTELLGADVLTAIERIGERTPSDRFSVFCENFATVLQSGGSTSGFLREQYERHQRRAETRQSMYLDWLATFAEAYVSLLVVGPLFLITVLIVMGLISGGVTGPLSLFVYLVIPLSNLGFVVVLDGFTGPLGSTGSETAGSSGADGSDGAGRSDRSNGAGATGEEDGSDGNEDLTPEQRATIADLTPDERARTIRSAIADPIGTVLDRPARLLYLTVPLACCWLAARVWLAWREGTLAVSTLDDTVVIAGILLTGTFALAHETRRRRIERIEAAIPELLDRLASLNEVGLSIVAAFGRLRESDLGELDDEIERIDRDVALGASVADALSRFDERVRTASVTRTVALVTNAMRASGDIAPILGVAAEEARSRRTRKRKRRQEMATYLAIIYLSFLVFLAIVFVLVTVFMPTIPSPAALGDSGFAGGSVGLSEAQKELYVRLLFHASAIQGVASGFVAGQMAKGHVANGAKHAAIMLTLAYTAFLLFA
jgi:flagellar protein FlaJ